MTRRRTGSILQAVVGCHTYEDTPDEEEIDWIAERVREICDYERLTGCDIAFQSLL